MEDSESTQGFGINHLTVVPRDMNDTDDSDADE